MLVEVVVESLARHALDDVAGEAGRVVRVGGHRAGLEDADRHPALDGVAERDERGGILGDQLLDRFLEPGGVRHDVAHADRLAVRAGRNLEIEVLVDVGVEVDLALLDQLHDRGPGEEL